MPQPPTAALHLKARALRPALLAGLLCLAALPAWALYKVVAPDGSVTYTDRPPTASNARITTLGRNATPVAEGPALPADLRLIAQRYPVTLYTAADCPPCDAGRQLLQQRGVPFTEKRVLSEDDAVVLERAVGGRTVPGLTIGSQPLRGLSAPDWTAYLDAAGYPRESRLPRGWQASGTAPAAERRAAPPVPAPVPEAAAPPPPVETPAEPASGAIRF